MSYRDLIRADGPALYWPLDATHGVTDQSGNGRNGTGVGGISIGGFSGSPVSEIATSSDLDGNNDSITSSYNPFVNGSVRTYEGWSYRDTSAAVMILFSSSAAASAAPILDLTAGTNVRWRPNGTTGTTTTWTSAWPGNSVWAHWGLVFDESADLATLYINGALVSAQAQATAYNASPGTYNLGARAGTNTPFDGQKAQAGIWERALTASEVGSHYQAGGGGANPASKTFIHQARGVQ